VQRKSILDCEREIVRLLTLRDRTELTPKEIEEWETDLERQVLSLWQTQCFACRSSRCATKSTTGLRTTATRS
jgi:phosphoenolpyruvate carboxylase